MTPLLTEADLVYHPSGRVVALIRGTEIHCSVSDDGGKTWTAPRPDRLWWADTRYTGSAWPAATSSVRLCPPLLSRWHPRHAVSYDVGESWDVEHEKVLRDDVPPNLYIGTPASVQLDDGTIFTYYNIVKGKEITPERLHCYVAGSRYTEDYIRPLELERAEQQARRSMPDTTVLRARLQLARRQWQADDYDWGTSRLSEA